MSKKKVIGIVAWKVGANSLGVTLPYLQFISNFGVPKFIFPWDKDTFDPTELDLMILPGGPDVDTERYDDIPGPYTGNPCIYKEHFDKYMLEKVIDAKVPILGICRGFQSLAVHFGAKLEQHIDTIQHGINPSANRQKASHKVKLLFGNLPIINLALGEVNSIHHQALLRDKVPLCFNTIATHADIKEHVEAIIHKDLPILAVQWHPEEYKDAFTVKLVEHIMNPNNYNNVQRLKENKRATAELQD